MAHCSSVHAWLARVLMLLGRIALAMLFLAGALQKALSPTDAQALLQAAEWPRLLVWPALALNLIGALALLAGIWLAPVAATLAVYCMITSFFHLIPTDPWQMSIFVKNWAIAGGLLVLCAHHLTHRD